MKMKGRVILANLALLVFLGACSMGSGPAENSEDLLQTRAVSASAPVSQHGALSVSGSNVVD